jgi:CheY-like chemotaxis protein
VAYTLLLADDSVTIQRVIELTFADEDIRVVAVSDGNQAIARVEEDPPDIVLADVGMPGKTGYEVSSYIKHQPKLAHIPVLLLTGAFEPVDQQKAAEAGCDGVLAKPFEPQIVIGRVKELLSRPRVAPLPSSASAAPQPAPDRSNAPDAINDPSFLSTSMVDYLDELDTALAKPLGARTETAAAEDEEHGIGRSLDRPGPRAPGEMDDRWDITFPSQPVEDPALPSAPPVGLERFSASAPAPANTPAAPANTPATPAPTVAHPSTPGPAAEPSAGPAEALPVLAVAFAAMLAAEQNPGAPVDKAWMPPLAISDTMIDRVAERVLAQLSDRIVREAVADLVSGVAERLVREEIERIKASIK